MSKLESNGVTSPPIEHRVNLAVMTYREECEQLRKQNAAQQAEVERLKGMVNEIQAAKHVFKEHNRLLTNLATSQAREQQLQEALSASTGVCEAFASISQTANFQVKENSKALAIQSDTTALEAMIQKAGGVMRGRCVSAIGGQSGTEAILALPGVTLEDLK